MRAAIVIANGYTDAEFIVADQWLRAHEIEPRVYSPTGGAVIGIMGWMQKASEKLSELDIGPDALILIGGVKAIEKLRLDEQLIKVIRIMSDRGKIIGSICHGMQLGIEADIVRGRRVSGYPSIKTDIVNAGGIWDPGPVCVDENIVSAPHYDHAGLWMKTVYEVMEDSVGPF